MLSHLAKTELATGHVFGDRRRLGDAVILLETLRRAFEAQGGLSAAKDEVKKQQEEKKQKQVKILGKTQMFT